MIPSTRTPEISEFMTGYTVNDYSYKSTKMNIHIPLIMIDRPASDGTTNIPINNIFANATPINTSSSVVSQNFITAKVSPLYWLVHDDPLATITKGTKVNVYCPLLDLEQATIIPLQ